jgi:transposase
VTEKTKKTKRSFSEEFKQEAVELAKKIGNSKAAKELDINESSIRLWKKKQESPESLINRSKKKSYDELEKELKRVQKELGYMKEINKVLKKSTAIFSADQMGSIK